MMMKLVVLCALLAVAVGMPRYVMVPVEDVQYMPRLVRVARQVRLDDPGQLQPSEDRFVRQAAGGYGGDQVDYGAYTGNYGSFGWYADYPVGGGKKY